MIEGGQESSDDEEEHLLMLTYGNSDDDSNSEEVDEKVLMVPRLWMAAIMQIITFDLVWSFSHIQVQEEAQTEWNSGKGAEVVRGRNLGSRADQSSHARNRFRIATIHRSRISDSISVKLGECERFLTTELEDQCVASVAECHFGTKLYIGIYLSVTTNDRSYRCQLSRFC